LSYLAKRQTDRQTNKQTKTGKNITSLAEVTIVKSLQPRHIFVVNEQVTMS